MERQLPTHEEARQESMRWVWMRKVRPAPVQAALLKLSGRSKRSIVVDRDGRRLFIDPATNAGWQVLSYGMYEPETIALLKRVLREGDCVLDVGANEGIVSAIAGTLVGADGAVVALEPQRRLLDLIQINCSLNGVPVKVVQGALGGAAGEQANLNLYPMNNTGASGLMRRGRFSWHTERTTFVSGANLLATCDRPYFDLVKVDVEGFEGEVVETLAPLMRAGRVRHLLLDYHIQILGPRGLDPEVIHQRVLSAGLTVVQGEVTGGYVLYKSTLTAPSPSEQIIL